MGLAFPLGHRINHSKTYLIAKAGEKKYNMVQDIKEKEPMVRMDDKKRIHLIGIGGCSMNGIARILQSQGHQVTGSDREKTQFTGALDAAGIPYSVGHTGEYVKDADLVIYSAAIKADNPERAMARELGIPELERSEALGQISERFEKVVAIAGCHGKTTITSMLALVNETAKSDATIHVGGYVEFLEGGVRVGDRETFITEACEYVESFLTLRPTIALINNIDDDHLDYFKDIKNIEKAFDKFVALLPETGLLVACTDDVRVQALMERASRPAITYGMARGDYHGENLTYDEMGCPMFDAVERGVTLGRVHLGVPGTHNVVNALGVLAVCRQLGFSFEAYQEAMASFQNTKRRFEYYGERNGVKVFHDYGHHPNEIKATLEAASRLPHGKLYCVFQCNSYTRAKTLFTENVTCFAGADQVLVPDIYPGREKDTGMVHAKDMVAGINAQSNNALYLGTFENIRTWLDENAAPGDLVVTVGSGDVYRQTNKLL